MVEKAAQPVMVPSFFTTQQSHAFPSIYANSLTVKMSHSDFSILFGHDSPNIVALTVGGRPGQGVSESPARCLGQHEFGDNEVPSEMAQQTG